MSVNDKARLYFEGHITLKPPTSEIAVQALKVFADNWDFRLASFLMMRGDTKIPDAFMSVRDASYANIVVRMKQAISVLGSEGFTVTRMKIEDTVYDTKHGDPWL